MLKLQIACLFLVGIAAACSNSDFSAGAHAPDGAAGDGGSAGSAGSAGDAGSAGGGTAGTGGGAAGTGGRDAGVECATLETRMSESLKVLKSCCPDCTSIAAQCATKVPGTCCDETINQSDTSEEALKYLEAYDAWKQGGCTVNCPEIACTLAPSYVCTPRGENGTCS